MEDQCDPEYVANNTIDSTEKMQFHAKGAKISREVRKVVLAAFACSSLRAFARNCISFFSYTAAFKNFALCSSPSFIST
jgi:hypothetical protein